MSKEFSFMNEKIKEKPFYKKNWVKLTVVTVILAVIFGAVSAVVFVKISSGMQSAQEEKQIEKIEIPKDQVEQPQETVAQTPEVTPEIIEKEIPLTLEKYGELYDEVQEVSKEVSGSLVTITAVSNDVDWFNESYETSGQSAGIIIGDNNVELLILTRYAAVKSCDGIKVTFADDRVVSGVLKKYDAATGLAVISVNLSDIPTGTIEKIHKAVLGNSVNLTAGEPVIALGRADGSAHSIKIGALTSVHKSQTIIDSECTVLVTDLMKNAGADGVLINLQGEIIGVLQEQHVTANAQNVLTAYGISDIKSLIEHLSNNQDVTYLGIRGVSVTEDAKKNGVPEGVYVTEVAVDSPAMHGGIQTGDVILQINGQTVKSMTEVSNILQKLSDKQNITLEGQRLTKDGYKKISYQTALSVLE